MFTGIVAAVGKIISVTALGDGADAGVRLSVDAGALALADVAIGDSIALNGACMTVTSKSHVGFTVDVSRESLNRTTGLDAIGEVNLEKALTLAERLGGHLVSGHVDGVGTVKLFQQIGESHELVVSAPGELAKYLAYKGSIVVNGVSLTVNRVTDSAADCQFAVNLIPHTVAVTTLRNLRVGDRVNLEIDLIARYVERMLGLPKAAPEG
jgi:riboflavin synthase